MSMSGVLGIAFVIVGFAAMFLMFHLWGYPFDKVTKQSAAPKLWMFVHRLLGYVFVALYVVMMWKMVPRLWEYQVEFPARTAIHIVVGFTVGFLLLVKIAIMRFFRHFEEWMPVLGTSIMLGTVILAGLSLPFVFQEQAMAAKVDAGRVALLLPTAGLPKDAPSATELATPQALAAGRSVLLEKCVKCHDLKTILAKPRTPSNWWETVERMADKPALFDPMTTRDLYDVTAYLIAITPDLQKASKRKRDQDVAREDELQKAMDAEAAESDSTSVGLGVNTAGASGVPGTNTCPCPVGSSGSTDGNAGSVGVGSSGTAGSSSGASSSNGSAGVAAGAPGTNTCPCPTVGAAGTGSPGSTVGSGAVGNPGPATTTTGGTGALGSGSPPVSAPAKPRAKPVDFKRAKAVYTEACSACHDLSDVDAAPPRTTSEVRTLIQRMIKENEASFTADEIKQCTAYMVAHYVEKKL